jgi:hypothetical protein
MKEISKKQFIAVCNEHKANLFLKIIYTHFSTDMQKSLGTKIIIIWMAFFNILAAILEKTHSKMGLISLALANIPFAIWGISGLIAFIWNNLRIKKIQKELEINDNEYNFGISMYYSEME